MKTWPSALLLLCVILCAGLVGACAATSGRDADAAPRVGVMHVGTDHNPPSLATLVAGLGDLGWFDGPPADVMGQLVGTQERSTAGCSSSRGSTTARGST